jgi:hypothetical protein
VCIGELLWSLTQSFTNGGGTAGQQRHVKALTRSNHEEVDRRVQLVRLSENKRLKVLLADLYKRKILLAG